ncbi:MAG: polysaccharide lyase, partial [Nitrososphaerales archaeon]
MFFGPDLAVRHAGAFGLNRWKAVSVGAKEPFDEAMRVEYPAGSASPAAARRFGSPEGGTQAYLRRIEGPVDDGYLRYWIRLSPNFEFRKGGKLPGVWGGTQVSGGRKPNGRNGFSTRFMWRAQGAGEVYLYAAGTAGKSLGRGSWRWEGGRWTCVEQHVGLNDPKRANGSIEVWLDGNEVYRNSRLRYRTVRSLKIEGIFFSTFFGGADPSWASPTDQYAEFAGFKLS